MPRAPCKRRLIAAATALLALMLPYCALAASSTSTPLPALRPEASADSTTKRLLVRVAGRPAAALAALAQAGSLDSLLFSDDDEEGIDAKQKKSTNNAPTTTQKQEDASRASIEWAVPLARSAPGPGRGQERSIIALTFAAQYDADEALLRLQHKAAARLAEIEAQASKKNEDAAGPAQLPAGVALAAEADAKLEQLLPSDDASLASYVAAPKTAASSPWPGAVLGGGLAYASAAAAVASAVEDEGGDAAAAKTATFLSFETSPEGCPPSLATVGDAVRCLWSSPRSSAWAVADAGGWHLEAYASEELKSAVEGCVCARGALLTTAASSASSLPAAFSPSLGGPLPCVLAVNGGEWWSSASSGGDNKNVVPADPRLASARAAGTALRLKNAVPAADGAQIARVLAGAGDASAVRDYAGALAALKQAVAEARGRALSGGRRRVA